ncbi:MAG: ABC transporter substrate-binding protein [Dehalococcoidia bacterium]|nr:ABC transporter substrate-binding protein [Dehalococcoidia bacterium]
MEGKRPSPRRFTRRAVLGGAAAIPGLAAAACSGGGGSKGTATPGTSTGTAPGSSATRAATSQPTRLPGLSDRHGETLRYSGFVSSDGVWDPHRTQAGPFYGQQALAFSRLLCYADQADGTIVPDLAAARPERPDAQTVVFRLNPSARWHERAPLDGRSVTAEDVKFSIERQMAGDLSFVRRARWSVIDTIESASPDHITFKLKTPFANAEGMFADVNAFIVPREIADAGFTAGNQVGSGPFSWVEWQDANFASVRRNPAWHGGGARPYLEGISVIQPKNTDAIEAGLRTKQLDAAFVGRKVADRLRENIEQLQEQQVGHSLSFGMRFFLRQVPYDDLRFRAALSIAVDRREMVQRFFEGSGDINPWVSWPIKRWTLPQSELTTFAGYRPGTGGRDADIAEAKALLAAFAAEKTVPADIPIFVESVAEANLGLGSLISEQLARNLGLKVTVYAVPIGELIRRMFAGEAPWVAGPDTGWVDLDDWLYPYFHSTGTNNSFPMRDEELDKLIESQRTELNEENRRAIGFDVQRKLLGLHAGVSFCSERLISLTWPYVKGFPLDTADGYQHRFADTWIDRNDPTFRGR